MTSYNYLVEELINETMIHIKEYEDELSLVGEDENELPQFSKMYRSFVTICRCGCRSVELNLESIQSFARAITKAMNADPNYLFKHMMNTLPWYVDDEDESEEKPWIVQLIEKAYRKLAHSEFSLSAHRELMDLFLGYPKTFLQNIQRIEQERDGNLELTAFFASL